MTALSDDILQDNAALLDRMLAHLVMPRIEDGTLPADALRRYLVSVAAFLRTAIAIFAQATAKVAALAHEAAEAFPDTAEDLSAWDVMMLSDIGANTLAAAAAGRLDARPTGAQPAEGIRARRRRADHGGRLPDIPGDRRARAPVEAALPVDCQPDDARV